MIYSECPVCVRAYAQNKHGSKLLCDLCSRSLRGVGLSVYDVIDWAAKRARRFERARAVGARVRE